MHGCLCGSRRYSNGIHGGGPRHRDQRFPRPIVQTRGGKASTEVTVVRNGPPVTPERWSQLPVRIREGRLDPARLAIAEILACLPDRTPHVRATLTLIGDGDVRSTLEALVRHGVADAVYIVGWVSAERVPELSQDADVCVDPASATYLAN